MLEDQTKEEAQPEVTAAVEPMLQFFEYRHLPDSLQKVSLKFWELAQHICLTLSKNPERTVALRKLLESKDCAVRARLYKNA